MRWLRGNYMAVALIVVIILSVGLSRLDSAATDRANERASVQRTIDTCRRGNPGRAYLQLRAHEIASRTAADADRVWAVLNCRETVRKHGQPVPLSRQVQDQYLELFEEGYIGITRGDAIVGKVPASLYFSGFGPKHP